MTKIIKNNQRGFTLIFSLILVLSVGLVIVIGISALSFNSFANMNNKIKSSQSYYTAEAGIEDSLYRIIKNKKYEATNNLIVDEGNAEINISEQGGSKVIKSKGNASQKIKVLKAVLTINTNRVSFHYGAQADTGGISLQPNAQIIGNVYSNGSIKGSGSSSLVTGDAWVAGGLAATPDQQFVQQNAGFSFGLNDKLDTAQSFVLSNSGLLSKVSLYLKKVGSPANQTVRILTDNDGKPSADSLASGTLYSSLVTSQYSWVDISFGSPPNLTAGQTYWIMVDVSQDQNNYWIWGEDTNNGYASGTAKYDNDWSKKPDWLNLGGDLDFKAWIGGFDTYVDNIKANIDVRAHSIKNSTVDRDGYYQAIENSTIGRNSYPGSPDPPIENLPISYAQIQDWEKDACCDTGNGCQSKCIYNGSYNPANGSSIGPLKIIGDLNFPHNGTVTITGPIWVTGNITASNNCQIEIQQDTAVSYAIIADNPSDQVNFGRINLSNNIITKDSPLGGYLTFISTNKPTVGFDPANPNIDNPAIYLSNNVNAGNPQSVIFSLNGVIRVENNAEFIEICGYALYLSNNSQVVYEYGLQNINFSAGPGAGWSLDSWEETE